MSTPRPGSCPFEGPTAAYLADEVDAWVAAVLSRLESSRLNLVATQRREEQLRSQVDLVAQIEADIERSTARAYASLRFALTDSRALRSRDHHRQRAGSIIETAKQGALGILVDACQNIAGLYLASPAHASPSPTTQGAFLPTAESRPVSNNVEPPHRTLPALLAYSAYATGPAEHLMTEVMVAASELARRLAEAKAGVEEIEDQLFTTAHLGHIDLRDVEEGGSVTTSADEDQSLPDADRIPSAEAVAESQRLLARVSGDAQHVVAVARSGIRVLYIQVERDLLELAPDGAMRDRPHEGRQLA